MNFYKTLGLRQDADAAVIAAAYRALAKKYHPDKTQSTGVDSTEMFRAIQNAYETLSDVKLRAIYDEGLATASKAKNSKKSTSTKKGGDKYSTKNDGSREGEFDAKVAPQANPTKIDNWLRNLGLAAIICITFGLAYFGMHSPSWRLENDKLQFDEVAYVPPSAKQSLDDDQKQNVLQQSESKVELTLEDLAVTPAMKKVAVRPQEKRPPDRIVEKKAPTSDLSGLAIDTARPPEPVIHDDKVDLSLIEVELIQQGMTEKSSLTKSLSALDIANDRALVLIDHAIRYLSDVGNSQLPTETKIEAAKVELQNAVQTKSAIAIVKGIAKLRIAMEQSEGFLAYMFGEGKKTTLTALLSNAADSKKNSNRIVGDVEIVEVQTPITASHAAERDLAGGYASPDLSELLLNAKSQPEATPLPLPLSPGDNYPTAAQSTKSDLMQHYPTVDPTVDRDRKSGLQKYVEDFARADLLPDTAELPKGMPFSKHIEFLALKSNLFKKYPRHAEDLALLHDLLESGKPRLLAARSYASNLINTANLIELSPWRDFMVASNFNYWSLIQANIETKLILSNGSPDMIIGAASKLHTSIDGSIKLIMHYH